MIVVTGATGNVGRALVDVLVSRGEDVTAVSRSGTSDRAVHRRADLAVPATLRPALEGADAVFLLVAGDRPEEVLDECRGAGVKRVVLLSSQGAATRPERYAAPRAAEEAVRRSGLDWTILRPGGFASNTLAWAAAIRAGEAVHTPFPEVGLPFVDPVDIAEVAAVALTGAGLTGEVLTVTGPVTTTPRSRVDAIAAAVGRPIAVVEQTRDEARAEMVRFMPASVVDDTLDVLGAPMPEEQRVSPDVTRVLGRPPRSFDDWVASTLPAFR
jgi:uncharacterized protein YbjT (DUF2867 family)